MEKKVEGIYDGFKELGTGKMLILGFQHVFAMFGATVLVPLLTGLSVSVTLFCAGIGTIWFSSSQRERSRFSSALRSHSSVRLIRLQTAAIRNCCRMQRSALCAQV